MPPMMRRLVLCLGLLFLGSTRLASALPLASDRPAADLDFRAYWSLEFHRPDVAVPLYGSILGVYPDYQDRSGVMFHLLRGYLDTGRFEDLYSLADQIRAEYPDTPIAAWSELVRGNAYRRRKETVRAAEVYKGVCRQAASLEDLGPVVAAGTKLGELFWGTAQEELANPPTETPTPVSTPEREAEAKAIYEQARGVLFREASPEETTQAMQDFVALAADYADTSYLPWARLRIADARFKLGQYPDAILAAQDVIADYPGTTPAAFAQLVIGKAYRKMGQLLDAYEAFRKLEAYDGLDDPRPAVSARQHTRRIWGALCAEHPEVEDVGWPTPGRDVSIANLATLNGYDPDEQADCAWMGACWMGSIEPPLTLGLFDEMAQDYPDQPMWLALAAIVGGDRFLRWADSQRPGTAAPADKEHAVSLLESVRALVPERVPFHVEADLVLARFYHHAGQWAATAAVAERGLSTMPSHHSANELACRLADSCIGLGRYEDAVAAAEVVTSKTNYPGWMWVAMYTRGTALAKQGRLAEASAQMLALSSLSNSPAWRSRGAQRAADYYGELGDATSAAAALETAIAEITSELAADDPHFTENWRGYQMWRLGKLESQLAALQAQGR